MTAEEYALIVGGIQCVLGAVLTTLGYLQRRTARAWMRGTAFTVAGCNGIFGDRVRPTFQWQDQHGQVHERLGCRSNVGPRTGDYLPILFDPHNPSRAIIGSFVLGNGQRLMALGIILLSLGIPAAITTLVLVSAFAP